MDEQTVALAAVVAGVIMAVLRYLDARDRRRAEERADKRHEEQQDYIAAAAERSRIRDGKRRRTSTPRASSPVPDFVAEETTDMFVLVRQEQQERARRESDRHETVRSRAEPRGERKPRPGTRSDKPYEE